MTAWIHNLLTNYLRRLVLCFFFLYFKTKNTRAKMKGSDVSMPEYLMSYSSSQDIPDITKI